MITFVKTWFFLLFFLLSGSLFSQSLPDAPLWERKYGKSGQDVITDITENWRGEIIAVGTSNNGMYGGKDIYLVIHDASMNAFTEHYIGRDADDGANSVANMPDGRILVAGYSSMPKKVVNKSYKGGKDGWLLFLNEKGVLEQEIILGTAQDEEFVNAFVLAQDTLLAVGNISSKAWLVMTTSSGNIIWEKVIQHNGKFTNINHAIMVKDQLFTVGYVEEKGIKSMWMAAFNKQGTKLWEKVIPTKTAAEGYKILQINEERLGIVGYAKDHNIRENGIYYTIDYSGNLANYVSVGGREDDRFLDAYLLQNGRIAAVGRSKSFSRGSRRDRIWTVILNEKDDKYEVKDEAFYGSKLNDESYAIFQRSSGGILSAGRTSQDILKSSQGWIGQFTKSLTPDELKKNLQVTPLSVKYNNGEAILPKERAYLPMTIQNPNKDGAIQLKAKITKKQSDAPLLADIILPVIPKLSTKAVYLPILLPDTLIKSGVYSYEIEIVQADKVVSERIPFELSVGESPVIEMLLTLADVSTALRRDKLNNISLTVQNTGNVMLKNVSCLILENTLQNQPSIFLSSIEKNAVKTFDIPYKIASDYPLDSIWLKLRLIDETLSFTKVVTLALPIKDELSISKPDTLLKPNKDFITAIWLHPNPDYYSEPKIVWDEEEIMLQVKTISSKTIDKQNFCLEVNGTPCSTGAKMDEVTLKGSSFSRTFIQKVTLKEGTNLIKAVIENDAGVTSTEELELIYSPRKPILHVVSIGVPALDLKYTTKDARDFVKAIQGPSKLNQAFQSIFLDTLTLSTNTTKTEILKTLRRLQYRFDDKQIMPQDLVVIFISAHGLSTTQGEFRIAASDYDSPFMQETSLDFEKEIINYISNINCQKLFFIDACHSGAGNQNGFSSQASGTDVVGVINSQKDINLILSCGANEYSYEDDNWRNGAFTKVLVQTFQNFAQQPSDLDTNGDNKLDINELYKQLQLKVPQLVQTKRPKPQTNQYPLLISARKDNPIILFQLPDKE